MKRLLRIPTSSVDDARLCTHNLIFALSSSSKKFCIKLRCKDSKLFSVFFLPDRNLMRKISAASERAPSRRKSEGGKIHKNFIKKALSGLGKLRCWALRRKSRGLLNFA